MLSSIVIALLQAVAGDPTTPADTAAAETAAPASQSAEGALHAERRRVCRTYEASTGGRLPMRRCRWEEVRVQPGHNEDDTASTPEASDNATAASDDGMGRSGAEAGAPSSPTP